MQGLKLNEMRRELDFLLVDNVAKGASIDQLTSDNLAKDGRIQQLESDNLAKDGRIQQLEGDLADIKSLLSDFGIVRGT